MYVICSYNWVLETRIELDIYSLVPFCTQSNAINHITLKYNFSLILHSVRFNLKPF